MIIIKVLASSQDGMVALMECEGCGSTDQRYGYDSTYFHEHQLPAMECPACAKSTNDFLRDVPWPKEISLRHYPVNLM